MTAYKTIVAHIHDPARASRILDAAVPLARQMDAHLIGLCVLPPFVVLPAMDAGGASVTVEEHRDAYRTDMETMKAAFEAATATLARPAEWVEADAGFGTVADVVTGFARSADIVIASQALSSWQNSAIIEDPIRVVMASGRPLLLIPNAGPVAVPAKRVTVAWDRRREAVRAVFDAMPILERAENVDAVWIDPQKDKGRAGDVPAADICTTLARHGVTCQATSAMAIDGDVGAELLRQTVAYRSDLLVMGCFGHSRFREFVLGGASRHVLAETEIPVLLSH